MSERGKHKYIEFFESRKNQFPACNFNWLIILVSLSRFFSLSLWDQRTALHCTVWTNISTPVEKNSKEEINKISKLAHLMLMNKIKHEKRFSRQITQPNWLPHKHNFYFISYERKCKEVITIKSSFSFCVLIVCTMHFFYEQQRRNQIKELLCVRIVYSLCVEILRHTKRYKQCEWHSRKSRIACKMHVLLWFAWVLYVFFWKYIKLSVLHAAHTHNTYCVNSVFYRSLCILYVSRWAHIVGSRNQTL